MKKVPIKDRFWTKVRIAGLDDCWNWAAYKCKKGYGITSGDNRKLEKAHRMAWILTNGKIPTGMQVCHKCDNPSCCNPSHLFLGTALDNALDCIAKGRAKKAFGTRNPHAKLNEEILQKAKSLKSLGETYASLGRKFGVDYTTIMAALKGKTWRHVQYVN